MSLDGRTVVLVVVYRYAAYRTLRVKSPGFEELGRARKLQSTPLSISNFSASIPLIVGQNHLEIFTIYIYNEKRLRWRLVVLEYFIRI